MHLCKAFLFFPLNMSDSTFEALSNIPGHISSFSASLKDASVIQVD